MDSRIKKEETVTHSDFLSGYSQGKSQSELMELFIEHLKKEHGFSVEEINKIIEEKSKEILLPISIFDNDKISALEAIVKYLKENKSMRFHDIASLIKRDDRTIWTTYSNAKRKMPELFSLRPSKYFIPLTIFANRNYSVLENLCVYLKENFGLSYHKIAVLLHRDDRTIWTTYNRAKKK